MRDKNNTLAYIKDIGKRLRNPTMYGAASLMVGAGFSKNAERQNDNQKPMPNWYEMAKQMYDELYLEEGDKCGKVKECAGKNVLTLAQKYEVAFGKNSLNDFIKRTIDDESYFPGELHKKLLELRWDDVFTTNYDTLLERGINLVATQKSYRIVKAQEDLLGSMRPRIIKLHGSVDCPDDFILTEEDYRTYPSKYAAFVNTVQQSMLETKLCLLGFSGNDPNFLSWLGWLRDNMGEKCPSIYLCGVYDKMTDSERKMLEKRRIVVVDLSVLVDDNSSSKHYKAVDKFLELLK